MTSIAKFTNLSKIFLLNFSVKMVAFLIVRTATMVVKFYK